MGNKIGSSALLMTLLCGAAGIAATVLLAGAAVTLAPNQAQALPAYAAQTGLPCGRCHVNPSGGEGLAERRVRPAANGHKLKK